MTSKLYESYTSWEDIAVREIRILTVEALKNTVGTEKTVKEGFIEAVTFVQNP